MTRALLEEDEDVYVVCPRRKEYDAVHFDALEVITTSGRSLSAVARCDYEVSTLSLQALNERIQGDALPRASAGVLRALCPMPEYFGLSSTRDVALCGCLRQRDARSTR